VRSLFARLADDVERVLLAGSPTLLRDEAFTHDLHELARRAERIPGLHDLAREMNLVAFAARLAQIRASQAELTEAAGDSRPMPSQPPISTRCGTQELFALVKALKARREEIVLVAITNGSIADLRLLDAAVESAGRLSDLALHGLAVQLPALQQRLLASFDPEGGADDRARLHALIVLGGAVGAVREALGRGNPAMRAAALEGAEGLDAEVVALVAGEKTESVLKASVPVLEKSASDEAVAALLRMLDLEAIRETARLALASSSHPRIVALLLAALEVDIRWRDEARFTADDFVEKVRKHVRQHHRKTVKRWPDEALETLVAAGIRRARKYGLTWESTLTAFVATMFTVAPNFDEHPHVKAILEDTGVPPNTKMDLLIKRLGEETWEEVAAMRDDKRFDALLAEEPVAAPPEQPEKIWAILKALAPRSDPRIAQAVLRHIDNYGGPPAEAAIESATADALRDIASKLYWEGEKVDCDGEAHRNCLMAPAVGAAIKLGPVEAFELLSPAVGDDSKAGLARFEAITARLDRTADKRWIGLILKLLDDSDRLKVRALKALAKIGDRAVAPYLVGLLKIERSFDVRRTVAEVLGELGDPRALEALKEVGESSPRLVAPAQEAIKRINEANKRT